MKKTFGKFQRLLVGAIVASAMLIPANPTFAINFRYGDVSGDEIVDSADYTLLRKYLLGIISELPSPYWEIAGDVNCDMTIDSADYTIMRSYLIGKISNLPIGEPRVSLAGSFSEHLSAGRGSFTTSFNISRGFIDVEYNYQSIASPVLSAKTQTVSLYCVDNDEFYSSQTINCPQDGSRKNTRLYWQNVPAGNYQLCFSNNEEGSAGLVWGEIYDGSRY